jgi:hypothetical protein
MDDKGFGPSEPWEVVDLPRDVRTDALADA